MPVVHLRALSPAGGQAQIDRALVGIATAVSTVMEADPRGTWCTFTAIDRMSLGAQVVEGPGQIAYVDLWTRSRGDSDGLVLAAACAAAADGLGVPVEDVWGTLRLVERGAVFAGGGLVGK